MRDIPAAEDITYDYAMTDGCDYDVFACSCRSSQCRRRITGSDWKIPALQSAYHGWFSDYIARLILKLGASLAGAAIQSESIFTRSRV